MCKLCDVLKQSQVLSVKLGITNMEDKFSRGRLGVAVFRSRFSGRTSRDMSRGCCSRSIDDLCWVGGRSGTGSSSLSSIGVPCRLHVQRSGRRFGPQPEVRACVRRPGAGGLCGRSQSGEAWDGVRVQHEALDRVAHGDLVVGQCQEHPRGVVHDGALGRTLVRIRS